MAPVQRSHPNQTRKFICSNSGERVWRVGDLTPEELDEIGPDATPPPNPSWTPEQYRVQMLMRGVVESGAANTLGFAGLLELAERFGLLEKRPNTEPVARVAQLREAVA